MINKPKILIICEGYEETEYLESIKKLNVWDNYDIDLINAESNGSLFSLYQYHYQNDNYDAHADQRKAIFDQININNYNIMKTNISKCSHKYYEISFTNFLKFVDNLELNDYTWIDNINNKI